MILITTFDNIMYCHISIVIVCAPVSLYVGLCVFSLPTPIVMIEKIYIFYITFIDTQVQAIQYILELTFFENFVLLSSSNLEVWIITLFYS